MENSAQFGTTKQLRNVGIIFLLVIGIAVGVYLAQRTQFFNPKAFLGTLRSSANVEIPRGEAIPGEVIVKYKDTSGLSERTLNTLRPKTLDDMVASKIGARNQVLPQGFESIESKYKITSSERIVSTSSRKITPDARSLEDLDTDQIYKLTFDNSISVEDLVQELSQNPLVEYAEPNYKRQAFTVPNDPFYADSYPNNIENRDPDWNPEYDYQWPLKQINAEAGWQDAENLTEILVAVVDTGVDYTHPEFGGCTLAQTQSGQCDKIAAGLDVINSDKDPSDGYGHGTHVAGTIAAGFNNSMGMAPVAPNAKILPIKVLDDSGFGSAESVGLGIIAAVDLGADVINMSLGSSGYSSFEAEALEYAFQNGVVVVAAAGNSNINAADFFPAGYICQDDGGNPFDCVITVAATDHWGNKAEYSNWGSAIDVAAPGGYQWEENVLSLLTQVEDNGMTESAVGELYTRASGTSMASPHVAGLAALVLGKNPNLNSQEVRNIILNGTDDDSQYGGFDMLYGFGKINVGKALQNMDTSTPPFAKISAPEVTATVGKTFKLYGTVGGQNFSSYKVEYSNVWNPQSQNEWYSNGVTLVDEGKNTVMEGELATLNLGDVPWGYYFVKVTTNTTDNKSSYSTSIVTVDPDIRDGFPIQYGTSTWEFPYVVADINQDGKSEIVYRNMNKGEMVAVQENGEILSGWPIDPGQAPEEDSNGWHTPAYSPVTTDLDTGYPGLETLVPAIVGGEDMWSSLGIQIRAFHADGTPVSGWTENDWQDREYLTYGGTLTATRLNGEKVIVYRDYNNVHIFRTDGSYLPGWPQKIPSISGNEGVIVSELEGTVEEVIILFEYTRVSVYSANGEKLAEDSISNDEIISKVILADVDKNGTLEIVVSTFEIQDILNGAQPYRARVKTYILNKDLVAVSNSPYVIEKDVPSAYGNGGYNVGVTDFNKDGMTDFMVMLDRQYYAQDMQGNILSGYPNSVDLAYDYYGGNPNLSSYVTLQNDDTLMAVGDSGNYTGTHLYKINSSMKPMDSYPKRYYSFNSRVAHSGYPALVDLDGDGNLELIIPVETVSFGWGSKVTSQIYVYNTEERAKYSDWPQQFKNAEHSNIWRPYGAPVPSPSIRPTITPTPISSPVATPSPFPSPVSSPVPTPTASPYIPVVPKGPGDINGDGFVNALDLREVIVNYLNEY